MKTIAKWVAILWSTFCVVGVIVGMANVGKTIDPAASDAVKGGQAIGMGCGMAFWIVAWVVIAGPAVIVYFVAGKRQPMQVQIHDPLPSIAVSHVCKECGKYYDGAPSFCPHCGKPVT